MSRFDKLPAPQLAKALQAIIDRRTREMNWPFDGNGNYLHCNEMVCKEVGTTGRNLRRWQSGWQPQVQFDKADEVITNMDLLWWDVWNADTVRKPVFTVMLRRVRMKRNYKGQKPMRCVEKGELHYGDLGTDWDKLREIEEAWCGTPAQGSFDQLAA